LLLIDFSLQRFRWNALPYRVTHRDTDLPDVRSRVSARLLTWTRVRANSLPGRFYVTRVSDLVTDSRALMVSLF